jgi:hypothetical protein
MRCRCCLTRSKEPVPHLGETPTRMPHIRAPCLGLDETGHRGRILLLIVQRKKAWVSRRARDCMGSPGLQDSQFRR